MVEQNERVNTALKLTKRFHYWPLTAQGREHLYQQNMSVCMCVRGFTLVFPLAFHRSMNYHTLLSPVLLPCSHPINKHVASQGRRHVSRRTAEPAGLVCIDLDIQEY